MIPWSHEWWNSVLHCCSFSANDELGSSQLKLLLPCSVLKPIWAELGFDITLQKLTKQWLIFEGEQWRWRRWWLCVLTSKLSILFQKDKKRDKRAQMTTQQKTRKETTMMTLMTRMSKMTKWCGVSCSCANSSRHAIGSWLSHIVMMMINRVGMMVIRVGMMDEGGNYIYDKEHWQYED